MVEEIGGGDDVEEVEIGIDWAWLMEMKVDILR